MDFKEIAAEARAIMNNEEVEEKQATIKEKTEPEIQFGIELVSHPDIVISKKTKTQTKYLVLMPTQKAYYIKTVKNAKNAQPEIERLDADNLMGFCKNANGYDLPEEFWIPWLPKNKAQCDEVMQFLNKPNISEMLKDGATSGIQYGFPRASCVAADAYNEYPALFRYFRNEKRFIKLAERTPETIIIIAKRYGLDNARKFFEELLCKSLVDETSITLRYNYYSGRSYNLTTIMENNLDIDSFIDYFCYESVTMGYALTMNRFIDDWKDAIEMQKMLYGKIKEKYPKNLPTYHQKLSYITDLKREEIEEAMFTAQAKKTKKFEAKVDDWIFIAPITKEDFYDEAQQQANCLAGYVKRFAEGRDYILFMRKKDNPEESVITIELDLDGTVLQAYRARNRNCSEEEWAVIRKWLKNVQ